LAESSWDWLNGVSQITECETFMIFNKEKSRFRLEKLRSACCSLSVFFKVLAARKKYLITANARKDQSIPLVVAQTETVTEQTKCYIHQLPSEWCIQKSLQ